MKRAPAAADIDRNIEEITTSSPEALKYYSEGLQYFLRGAFRRSITFSEKALAVDPDRSFSGTTDSFGTV